jgi:polyisoprenoid-binding protein YceI
MALLSGPATAMAADYEIDAVHSSVQFGIKHMMVSTVRGEFRAVSGRASLDDRDLKAARVEANIEAASIDTRNASRDAHLRSPDFFDVEKYPRITFTSREVKKVGAGKYKVAGTLDLHGVQKTVVLDVESSAQEVKNPEDGSLRRGAVAKTTLNRKDFGLHWNQALEAGGVLVGETVQVTLDLQLVRKDGAKTASAQ